MVTSEIRVVADREQIFDYIEADNPRAAVDVDSLIAEHVAKLQQFPHIGRIGRVDNTRELVIIGTLYVAAYCIDDDIVRILRILHGARSWPDEFT